MRILLFVGAGGSVEAGIPAMRAMVEEFQAHIGRVRLSGEVLGPFNDMLARPEYDMENLIEHVASIESGQASQRALGFSVDEGLLTACRTMRWEAEWFVQYVCERFRSVDAKVLWGAVLRNLGDHELCVATTNYDRLLEVACEIWKVPFDDGFEEFGGDEAVAWRGVRDPEAGRIGLLKLHGSTDWYKDAKGGTYKLRHSMPLYGELALLLDRRESPVPELKTALILPTREKLVNEPPYPDLTTGFRNFSRATDVAIFVGTSLRDPDILDICRQCAERVPTYLVNRRGNAGSIEIPNLKVIRGTASGFLTSTLPKSLVNGVTGCLDECASGVARTVGGESVLATLVAALEETAGVDEACEAIEELVRVGAALDASDIGRLVGSPSLDVRKYGLALIPAAVDVSKARALAEQQAAMEGEGVFATELAMLRELMREV